LTEFEKVNNNSEVKREWIIGSLDVDALYLPSLNIARCAAVVGDRLYFSDLELSKVDWKEIALYLRYHLDDNEIREKGLDLLLPTRKTTRGRPPIFTGAGSEKDTRKRHAAWIFPEQTPEGNQRRRMFCYAIEVMIRKTMALHDFQFDGNIHRQKNGGSIGLDLTGVISDIYMCEWDEELMLALQVEGFILHLYKRYKDDVNMILECEDKVLRGEEEEGTRSVRVMRKIKRLADGIDQNLKVTTDIGENHEGGKLPILDLGVWIGADREGILRILHSHYMKGVASRAVMDERSSHNENVKFHVMVNEVDRILKNCSVYLDWKVEAVKHASYYMRRMQYSGYSEKVRYSVLRKALDKYDTRVQAHQEGRTMYGPEVRGREKKKRGARNHDWYKEDKYESVMFVEATPKSVLKDKVERLVTKHKLKIKVVERVGTTVQRILQRSNPFPRRHCQRDNCEVCRRGCGIDCRLRGCVYEIVCKEEGCGRRYRGHTGRSTGTRTGEHVKNWRNKDEKCPLYKHSILYHNGQEFEFDMKILARCYGKPSRRRISEAVYIDELSDDKTMNSKREWTYIKLNKVNGRV
jgi:hypothetical protein